MQKQQQYLVKKDDPNKYIFARTEALAKRPDMVPCDKYGNALLFTGGDAAGMPRVAVNTAVTNLMNALGCTEEEAVRMMSGEAAADKAATRPGLSITPAAPGNPSKRPSKPPEVQPTTVDDELSRLKTKKDVAEYALDRFAGHEWFVPFPVELANHRRGAMEKQVREWIVMLDAEIVAEGNPVEGTPDEETGYENP